LHHCIVTKVTKTHTEWCRTHIRPMPDSRSGWQTRPTIQAGQIQCHTATTSSYMARANWQW